MRHARVSVGPANGPVRPHSVQQSGHGACADRPAALAHREAEALAQRHRPAEPDHDVDRLARHDHGVAGQLHHPDHVGRAEVELGR